ncbi:MAG TPA: DegV family protein, partial [Aggregatilineales bacterium]|nr:DegV family protein [Aggregatilineales bacterium]
MSKIRIVVDSAVDFPAPTISKRYHITVVPYTIRFGEEVLRDGQDIDAEQMLQRLGANPVYPLIEAPTVEQYTDAFLKLSQRTDQVLVLTTTKTLGQSFENAKIAATALHGRCNILVLDSKTTSVGLGMLAEIAAEAAEKSESIENVVRIARGAIDRVYAIFYVDTLDFIQHSGLLGEAQAVLGTMLGIKPFLTIEDGNLVTMEKVRTR